jgi:hypothetical protein
MWDISKETIVCKVEIFQKREIENMGRYESMKVISL